MVAPPPPPPLPDGTNALSASLPLPPPPPLPPTTGLALPHPQFPPPPPGPPPNEHDLALVRPPRPPLPQSSQLPPPGLNGSEGDGRFPESSVQTFDEGQVKPHSVIHSCLKWCI